MYALRQPSSFEFGKYGAVVFPSHEDAFNYELLNSLGDHEAQLRRVCEPHVRQALIAVTVGNNVIPPNIMIHGEHYVLASIEEFIEEIGVMTPIGSFPGSASLDLLYPHVVTKLGDDLIYSEEWRLLALKNLVLQSMANFDHLSISMANEERA